MQKKVYLLLCIFLVACIPSNNTSEAEPIAGSSIEIERVTATSSPEPSPTYSPVDDVHNHLTQTATPPPPTIVPFPTVPAPPTPVPPPHPTNYPDLANCVVPDGWVLYTVQEGDTIYNLATRTMTDLSSLYTVNCMIFGTPAVVGQELALLAYPEPLVEPAGDVTEIDCRQVQIPASSGLQVGATGEAVTQAYGQHVAVYRDKASFIVDYGLRDNHPFTVLEGPYCFSSTNTDAYMPFHRRWKVSFSAHGQEGWVDEFRGVATQYTYQVVPEGAIIPPDFGFFSVSPDNPQMDDVLTINWQLNRVSTVNLSGAGIEAPGLTGTGGYSILASELFLDEFGCATLYLNATAVNTIETYTQDVCIESATDLECPFERLTTDPTLPFGCPLAPPAEANAFMQTFEHGKLFWYEHGEEGRYDLIAMVNQHHESMAFMDVYEGDDANGRFAHALETYPAIQERLGALTGELQTYTTRWQEVQSHYVVVMPDGSLTRYLLYNDSFGEWIPISPNWNPNG